MLTSTKAAAVSLVVGPALLAASSVAWIADSPQVRGALAFWAIVLVGVGLHGIVLRRLAEPAPTAHAVLGVTLAAGVAAGAAFAVEMLMVDTFAVDRLVETGDPAAILTLNLPGTMFPISVIAIGVFSWRKQTLPVASALLLALAGIVFPMSRIGEVAALAVVSDLLLVAATAPIALAVLRGGTRSPSRIAQPALG